MDRDNKSTSFISPNSKTPLFVGYFIVTLLSLVIGFYLGRQTSNPAPIVHKDYITPSPIIDEKENWHIYRNEKLGFEMKLPTNYVLIKDENTTFTFGAARNGVIPIPLLTISTTNLTPFASYKYCDEIGDQGYESNKEYIPCIIRNGMSQDTQYKIEATLGNKDAVDFYVSYGIDSKSHIIQTTSLPKIEMKMFVAGGGLDEEFKKIISSFVFLNKRSISPEPNLYITQ